MGCVLYVIKHTHKHIYKYITVSVIPYFYQFILLFFLNRILHHESPPFPPQGFRYRKSGVANLEMEAGEFHEK